jgi:hypothetical protein
VANKHLPIDPMDVEMGNISQNVGINAYPFYEGEQYFAPTAAAGNITNGSFRNKAGFVPKKSKQNDGIGNSEHSEK